MCSDCVGVAMVCCVEGFGDWMWGGRGWRERVGGGGSREVFCSENVFPLKRRETAAE